MGALFLYEGKACRIRGFGVGASLWAAPGAGWFCMRGMVAAAIPSLTHALDSRNSGAAPGRPVCVRKEGLPSSEVRCGRSMGQPPILGRPGGGLVLYEGRGLGRIGALKPGPDLAKSLGRPSGRLFYESMKGLPHPKFDVGAPWAAARPGPPHGWADSAWGKWWPPHCFL